MSNEQSHFSGDHSCRGRKGSGQKVLERHTGQGHGEAQGLSPGWQHSFTPGSAQKERHFAVCQNTFHPLPAATGPLQITGVHKEAGGPLVQPTVLTFLGICWQRPHWAGSSTAHFSKKRICLKGIRREVSLGISSFPHCHTGSDACLDLGRGLMGWVLGAVGVGEALGAPAWYVTGDSSGHQCQGRTHSHSGGRQTPSGMAHSALLKADPQLPKDPPVPTAVHPPAEIRQIMHAPAHPRWPGRSCRDPLWPYLLRLSSFPAPSSLSPVTHGGA